MQKKSYNKGTTRLNFNLILAIKWRQLLQHAEKHQLINPGLFGGRPGCEAQSLTFLEELKYDISFTTRRSLYNFDNDASSCYDRIVLNLASLINRKYGQHKQTTTLHATTLQAARFHLRNSQGDISKEFYSHSLHSPIHGSGQGSGNSPCIWLLISSTLCDAHNRMATGASFTTPDQTTTVRTTMVGYVDDCTGTYNNFQPQHELPQHIMEMNMQQDAQTWNDLLWCSGGILELQKCSYHSLSFTFQRDGTPCPDLSCQSTIEIIDCSTGLTIPISQTPILKPHKTLGHWKAPLGRKNNIQLQALIDKSKRNSIRIASSSITKFGAYRLYIVAYVQALKFVLPQCYFSIQQLQTAEAKTIGPIIAKCGYNRNISKVL